MDHPTIVSMLGLLRVSLISSRRSFSTSRGISQSMSNTTPWPYRDPYIGKDAEYMARYRAIYERWYYAPVVPQPWSCEWRYWAFGRDVPYFIERFREDFGINGVEPVAFLPAQPEPIFFFASEGGYYMFNDWQMLRFNAKFESHADFLRRVNAERDNVMDVDDSDEGL
ncbi:hypothetical protein B0H19DRAFT_1385465 [Mycena capillaripes]|nr:hypothetical protein B0H19DRAFT_1385465 [Mycena capillaripes]